MESFEIPVARFETKKVNSRVGNYFKNIEESHVLDELHFNPKDPPSSSRCNEYLSSGQNDGDFFFEDTIFTDLSYFEIFRPSDGK